MAEEEKEEQSNDTTETESTDTDQISNNDLLEMFDEVKGLIITLTETVEKTVPVEDEKPEKDETDDKFDSEESEEEEEENADLDSQADELLKNI